MPRRGLLCEQLPTRAIPRARGSQLGSSSNTQIRQLAPKDLTQHVQERECVRPCTVRRAKGGGCRVSAKHAQRQHGSGLPRGQQCPSGGPPSRCGAVQGGSIRMQAGRYCTVGWNTAADGWMVLTRRAAPRLGRPLLGAPSPHGQMPEDVNLVPGQESAVSGRRDLFASTAPSVA